MQRLHKARPSTTLYYKASTKCVPVLLCTTRPKYFTVLLLYYKACKKYFPVVLCAPKLATNTSQYYFVLDAASAALNVDTAIPLRFAQNGFTNCSYLQLQNRVSTPKRKNDDSGAFLKGFKKKHNCQNGKNAAKAPFATFMLPLQHDLRLSATKHITPAAAAARKIHAAIPLQSADIELHNTIELQQATVEHIAWMQQFQCTKHFMTCKTQKHSINKEQKKSPGTLQLH